LQIFSIDFIFFIVLFYSFRGLYLKNSLLGFSMSLTDSFLVAMRESIALEAPGAGAVVAAGQVAALRLGVAAGQTQAALVYVGAARVGPHHRASGGAV
jgi:hypothetical protein